MQHSRVFLILHRETRLRFEPRWDVHLGNFKGHKVIALKHRPTFEIAQSGSGGYLVVVTWPSGPEECLDGFGSLEEARAWIEENGPSWVEQSEYLH
jgi:hypothetical protein